MINESWKSHVFWNICISGVSLSSLSDSAPSPLLRAPNLKSHLLAAIKCSGFNLKIWKQWANLEIIAYR